MTLFTFLSDWCNITGNKILFLKTKYLHICRQKFCNKDYIIIAGNQIEGVERLKVLQLTIKKIIRLNLIKYLAQTKNNSHPTIILNIVRSLIYHTSLGYLDSLDSGVLNFKCRRLEFLSV